jgi:hypothetical protein
MDTTVWERAVADSADVDRRESRLIVRAVLAAALVLALLVGAGQVGLTRPALTFTGTTITAFDAQPGRATVHLDVRNRGIFAERLTGLEAEYPGLTVLGARLHPETLGAFEQGQLTIDVHVDCETKLASGAPAWDQGEALDDEIAVEVSTARPWGSVSDTSLGRDAAWGIVSAGSTLCGRR